MRKILVGYDGSEPAKDALVLARSLAGVTGFQPLVVTVKPVLPAPGRKMNPEDLDRALARECRGLFAEAKEVLGPDLETRAVAGMSALQALHDLGEQEDVAVVVIGSAHRGPLGRVFAGSLGLGLLSAAPCSIAIAPRGYADRAAMGMQRIAVAYDGSPESATALMAAFGLAERTHATVLLIAVAEVIRWGYGEAQSVVTDEEYMSHERRSLEELIGDAIANAPQGVRVEGAVLAGPIAETVASAAGDVDLLLAGSRGYGPVRRVLLGSTTAKLMGISPAPILILPRSAGNDPLVEWHEEPMALDPYSPLP